MRVEINANMVDQSTSRVADALQPVLKALSEGLSADYGGVMENLWIDLELIESHARPDGKPRHTFRFQKRVSGRSHFGLPPAPDSINVGHFSVRPDFERIRSLTGDEAVAYALSLMYRGTEVLNAQSKRLGGFNAEQFRQRFLDACKSMGFRCEA